MSKTVAAPETDGRRLILVTQWFDPEPTFKGLLFARALQERGFLVEVVTGFPNYPGGELYSGYRLRPMKRETIDGVQVTRLALYPSHGQSAAGRIINYASFMISAFVYLTFVARRADVVYVYHPPVTVGIAAATARIFRKFPLVLDIQDMWPESLTATGMIKSRAILSFVNYVCVWVYKIASQVVVLSPGFATLLEDKGVPASKISVIYNWADLASVTKQNSARALHPHASGRFQILFAGNMGKAQALDTVIEAAKLLLAKNAQIDFVMLGGGIEVARLKKRVGDEKISNVHFLSSVPMKDVGNYIQSADALLVHLKDDPLFRITVPSKTQAYMAAGKPVIMAVAGDAAEIIEKADCGIIAAPENPYALAQAAIDLAALPEETRASMGISGRAYYDRNLSLQSGVRAFEKIFLKARIEKRR